MTACPVCRTATDAKIDGTPYFLCGNCDLGFQHPLPPKTFHHEHESDGSDMSEREKQINRELADYLFDKVMGGSIGGTLDIGAKYPILASYLLTRGCDAKAMEAAATNDIIGVPMVRADFESVSAKELIEQHYVYGNEYTKLITMIHTFEHMYDPLAALRKLRALVADDGRVFIRSPDHRIGGRELHMSADHWKIHPYFWTTRALLQALVEVSDCFVIESASPMVGGGQTDFVLRPVNAAPRICMAMIVKNEERDLPRMIESFSKITPQFAVVDTGSTDKTDEVLRERGIQAVTYIGASEQDDTGDWKLWDFGKARNVALALAESTEADWIIWADADDECITPDAFRRASYYYGAQAYGNWIDGGGMRWVQHRMYLAASHVRFKGRCHEYPILDGLHVEEVGESLIRHHGEPTPGIENSNPRNLRILLREWDEEQTPRTAFYLANTYRDAGRNAEAIVWYEKRIELGEGFRDEWLFAILSAARCYRALGSHGPADELCRKGLAAAPDWAEFKMDLANGAYNQKLYGLAAAYALDVDYAAPIPKTVMWREPWAYRDAAPRLLSWIAEHEDRPAHAIAWAEVAARLIDGPDPSWDDRRNRLVGHFQARKGGKYQPPATERPRIAIHRPGAIGDVLMSLNLIPALREANPGHDIHYFCSSYIGDGLSDLMRQAGVDLVMDSANMASWRKQYARVIDLVGYLQPGYPEEPLKVPIIEAFGWEIAGASLSHADYWPKWPDLPSLELEAPPDTFLVGEAYATLQITAAWSPYKNWPKERWQAVVDALPEINFRQIAKDGDPLLSGNNVANPMGMTLMQAVTWIANARIHVGVDSFAQHIAHYYWRSGNRTRRVPSVILFGSTQATATGYDDNVNISKGLACQPCFREDPMISRMPRDPCFKMTWDLASADRATTEGNFPLLHDCMNQITVDEVVAAIRKLWKEQT